MTTQNHQWKLVSRPQGRLTESNFEWSAEPIAGPDEGQLLLRTILLSLDPANRGWTNRRGSYRPPVPLDSVMQGITISQVVHSRHPEWHAGDLVLGFSGWQEYEISNGRGLRRLIPNIPLEVYFGPLGMVGLTAYFGLLTIGAPKEGETIVVSAAAGAVGSLVGQIGKIQDCRVVGIAGTEEKCAWIQEELGFDAAINYRQQEVAKALKHTCPDGIDVYFDNVGGKILDAALGRMNNFGRVPLCGLISMYNAEEPVPGPMNFPNILTRRLKVQGFIVSDFAADYKSALSQLAQWWQQGKLVHRTHIVEGLRRAPSALNMLFDGKNEGKLIVRVADVDHGKEK